MTTQPGKEASVAEPTASTPMNNSVSPTPTPAPRARASRWLAVLTGLLFFSWLGYLIFLVATLPHAPGGGPVVLSRPQFLVSDLDVIATIDAEQHVVVQEVFYPRQGGPLPGQAIVVTNLTKCGPFSRSRDGQEGPQRDFIGPGRYILALRPTALMQAAQFAGMLAMPGEGLLAAVSVPPSTVGTALCYEVVPVPPSPGYPPSYLNLRSGPPRIYHDIPATRAQLREIDAGKEKRE